MRSILGEWIVDLMVEYAIDRKMRVDYVSGLAT